MVRRKREDILDTSEPPMNLDVTAPDMDVRSDGLIVQEGRSNALPADSIVFYMRMRQDLLNHIKQIARELSYKEQKDITYQMLICEAVEEKYPINKK